MRRHHVIFAKDITVNDIENMTFSVFLKKYSFVNLARKVVIIKDKILHKLIPMADI